MHIFILQNSDYVQEGVDEETLGGMGYTDCFQVLPVCPH